MNLTEKRNQVYFDMEEIEEKISAEFDQLYIVADCGNEFKFNNFRIGWCGSREDKCFELGMIVKNSKYHWASEIVRSEFKINQKGEVESSFNAGSGGWNDFDTKSILEVFESSLTMTRCAIEIAEENSFTLFNLLAEREELSGKGSELNNEIKKIEDEKKANADQEKIDSIFKDYVKVEGETLFNELLHSGKECTRIKLVKVEKYYDGYKILRTLAELENFGRKRFELNGAFISKQNFVNFNFTNYFYRKEDESGSFYGPITKF